jgi:hypothetical protein
MTQQPEVSPDAREAFEDLLASIYLYVPWNFVTSQLETVQKDLWADAIDAWRERAGTGGSVDRWWRA